MWPWSARAAAEPADAPRTDLPSATPARPAAGPPRPRAYVLAFVLALLVAGGLHAGAAAFVSSHASDAWQKVWDVTEQRQVFGVYRQDIARAHNDPHTQRVYFLGSSTLRHALN